MDVFWNGITELPSTVVIYMWLVGAWPRIRAFLVLGDDESKSFSIAYAAAWPKRVILLTCLAAATPDLFCKYEHPTYDRLLSKSTHTDAGTDGSSLLSAIPQPVGVNILRTGGFDMDWKPLTVGPAGEAQSGAGARDGASSPESRTLHVLLHRPTPKIKYIGPADSSIAQYPPSLVQSSPSRPFFLTFFRIRKAKRSTPRESFKMSLRRAAANHPTLCRDIVSSNI